MLSIPAAPPKAAGQRKNRPSQTTYTAILNIPHTLTICQGPQTDLLTCVNFMFNKGLWRLAPAMASNTLETAWPVPWGGMLERGGRIAPIPGLAKLIFQGV